MTLISDLTKDFNEVLKYGEQVRFKYYTQILTGEYDDDVTLTQSGNDFWTSGLVSPIDARFGGKDSLLLQQGKVKVDDKKVYVVGTVQTSGLGMVKIGMGGSPTNDQYEILEEGQNTQWGINGSIVYKKIYVRYLPNGSFIGE